VTQIGVHIYLSRWLGSDTVWYSNEWTLFKINLFQLVWVL